MQLIAPIFVFPVLSLLLLAHTNRFLALASLVRALHAAHLKDRTQSTAAQISSLRKRISLLCHAQASCTISIFFAMLSLIVPVILQTCSFLALISIAYSLWCSLRELLMSTDALDIVLKDMAS